jgi:hypothetical protein
MNEKSDEPEIDSGGRITDSGRQRIIKENLAWLDGQMEAWRKRVNDDLSVLTINEINCLRILVEKTIKTKTGYQNLSGPQRETKNYIHEKLRNAFSDIVSLIQTGIMGYNWNPKDIHGSRRDLFPYPLDTWKKDYPVASVSDFIERLVTFYGDEYAVPIANGIAKGLRNREGWDSTFEIDVPVIRRTPKTSYH